MIEQITDAVLDSLICEGYEECCREDGSIFACKYCDTPCLSSLMAAALDALRKERDNAYRQWQEQIAECSGHVREVQARFEEEHRQLIAYNDALRKAIEQEPLKIERKNEMKYYSELIRGARGTSDYYRQLGHLVVADTLTNLADALEDENARLVVLEEETQQARELLTRVRDHLNETGTQEEAHIFGEICTFLNQAETRQWRGVGMNNYNELIDEVRAEAIWVVPESPEAIRAWAKRATALADALENTQAENERLRPAIRVLAKLFASNLPSFETGIGPVEG